MEDELIEIMAKGIAASKGLPEKEWPKYSEDAQAAFDALRDAQYEIIGMFVST